MSTSEEVITAPESNEIDLTDDVSVEPPQQQHASQEQSTNESSFNIPRKPVNQLTDAERKYLIANAKAGNNNNEFFEVKLFKNGTSRICKRKAKETNVSDDIINNEGSKTVKNTRTYLSTDQLIFEHIISLESKYERMLNKHKKLKRRYKDLYNDLYDTANAEQYADDDDNDDELPQQQSQIPVQQPQQIPQEQQPVTQPQQHQQQPRTRSSWRSYINYM